MRAPSHLSILALFASLLACAAIGCRQKNVQPPAPAPPVVEEGSFRTDAQIEREVQMRLSSNPALGGELISATVENGVVRLSGTVGDFGKAGIAAGEAGSVPGVRRVLNRLEIR